MLSVKSIKNLKSLNYHIFLIKYYFFLVFITSMEGEQIYIEEESI